MKYIELTSPNGKNSIWVRPECIEDIFNGPQGISDVRFTGSVIVMASGREIDIRETQDELLIKLEDHDKNTN